MAGENTISQSSITDAERAELSKLAYRDPATGKVDFGPENRQENRQGNRQGK